MKLFYILIFALFFQPINSMEITIPSLPVSPSGTEADASIVIDPEGNMTAVWSEQGIILTSDLPLYGEWSIPVPLSRVLKSSSSPKMEIDPSGNVTVLWCEENLFKVASRPFKGAWRVSKMTPILLQLPSENSSDISAPPTTVLALTPNWGGGGEAGDSKKSRSTGGTLRVKTAPQKESSSPDSPPTEKSPYLPMSSNAFDAPSGGALSGLQVGFAAGTSAPTGGGIFSGSVGVGTSSVTNTLLNLVNTANPYTVQATGSMINVDGFSAQYGLTLQNGFNPTNGSTLSADLAMLSAFIAPSGKTIASAAGVYVDLSAQSNVGTITNMYGVWIDNSFKSTGGTVTNNYGLYVSQPQGSATVTSTAYFDAPVGIGAVNPTTSTAALSITSTTQGFLEPVMTTTQKNAISSPATGLQVYDSTLEVPQYYNGTAWVSTGNPPGTILMWGGVATSPPAGYLLCDGTSYLRTTYPALFAAISTAYGAADSTHFNVPDLRGKFPRGVTGTTSNDPDASSRTAQATGGNTGNNVGSIQSYQIQSHSHGTLAGLGAGSTGNNALQAAGSQTYTYTGLLTGGNETRPINVYVNFIIKY